MMNFAGERAPVDTKVLIKKLQKEVTEITALMESAYRLKHLCLDPDEPVTKHTLAVQALEDQAAQRMNALRETPEWKAIAEGWRDVARGMELLAEGLMHVADYFANQYPEFERED
jgi:hypothetical protein